MTMSNIDGEDADPIPFELELPDYGDAEGDAEPEQEPQADDTSFEDGMPPAAPSLLGTEDPRDTLPLDTLLGTLAEEPSVLGDEEDGLLSGTGDDGLGVGDEDPSFLGVDEGPSADGETDLEDDIALGPEDGGAEGVDDPDGEAVDELPPLDGQDDGDDDDTPDEAFAPELAQLGVS
jgi:hypothetical protein